MLACYFLMRKNLSDRVRPVNCCFEISIIAIILFIPGTITHNMSRPIGDMFSNSPPARCDLLTKIYAAIADARYTTKNIVNVIIILYFQ